MLEEKIYITPILPTVCASQRSQGRFFSTRGGGELGKRRKREGEGEGEEKGKGGKFKN
jgi:hypothetical protein